ncbi:hypothetical protein [Levilactobacillus parabrevis]|uniref:Uncharacterized protein n=1 Tax=Levilactobacillus parabrevis ATCC 53295 TaxID=1267003 RepID=A0A0R1H1F2_9LACO|nr:hypothetical protein [Levilactobacillus parabrevis]KRK38259.1 hypothetical protein FD07_GL002073 [Levilactobacillus parabrevis ATCC 53295]KRO06519.1 hypothetical protein IV61_GL002389 [Levilactobacillus parabrevis]
MEETDATAELMTPTEFLTPEHLTRLSANQQKYATDILQDVTQARATVNLGTGAWTAQQVSGTLAALPTLVDRPHVYYVAVIPVLMAYFKAQAATNLSELLAALKQARPALVEKHAEVAEEQQAYEGVVTLVEDWLAAMGTQPEVHNLSAADRQRFVTIVHTTAELMITGKKLQPVDWDAEAVSSIMFGPFTHLLDEKDRVPELFNLVPFALTTLFTYLADQQQLKQSQELLAWVAKNHTALVTMYNPKLESFYEELASAMRRAGIDANDHDAVDAFTRDYLNAHPVTGRELFTTDRQLTKKRPAKHLKYSRKQRRNRRKKR